MKPLILIGGGGHCKSVIEAAESSHRTVYGILDANAGKETNVLGYPVLGDDSLIPSLANDFEFIVTVGQIKSPDTRVSLHKKVFEYGGKLSTVIASSARISKHAKIGMGTVILHNALVNAGAMVGIGCIINSFVNIEHDVVIDDYCHISTGAMINGDCKISYGAFIGSQSTILNGVNICEKCVIGAGSLVRKNIIKVGIYSGIPVVYKGMVK